MKWKLTIKQIRPIKYGETLTTTTERITFVSEDLAELTILIERFAHCETACETSYKIEKAGEDNE